MGEKAERWSLFSRVDSTRLVPWSFRLCSSIFPRFVGCLCSDVVREEREARCVCINRIDGPRKCMNERQQADGDGSVLSDLTDQGRFRPQMYVRCEQR